MGAAQVVDSVQLFSAEILSQMYEIDLNTTYNNYNDDPYTDLIFITDSVTFHTKIMSIKDSVVTLYSTQKQYYINQLYTLIYSTYEYSEFLTSSNLILSNARAALGTNNTKDLTIAIRTAQGSFTYWDQNFTLWNNLPSGRRHYEAGDIIAADLTGALVGGVTGGLLGAMIGAPYESAIGGLVEYFKWW